jgi:hypothetical protein
MNYDMHFENLDDGSLLRLCSIPALGMVLDETAPDPERVPLLPRILPGLGHLSYNSSFL